MSGQLLAKAALLLAAVTGGTAVAEDQGRNTNQPAVSVTEKSSGLSSDKRPADAKGSTAELRVAPRNPRVLFITAKDCEPCDKEVARLRQPGGVFEGMRSIGWKIGETPDNHIQIVDRDSIPDLVRQLNVREFPTVACINDGEIIRSFKDGCSTPLDAWTFGWLMKGQNERPQAAIPEAIRVATTGQYTLRGNHWSIDGDWNPTQAAVINHLRGPNHGHQITANNWQIESWSYEELRSLHDDLHEREGGGAYAQTAPARTGVNQFSAGRKF